jgi:hypothetical protein
MRLAYADPPYPGRARELYGDHPDYAGEVDHRELIEKLETYDGWALSTSSRSLRSVLELCPENIRILIWLNHNVGRSWEPVLVRSARPIATQWMPLDWIRTEVEAFQWRPPPEGYVIGRKPREFCRWLFKWLGARPGEDSLDDIFPGSGAVTQAWEEWTLQPELARVPGRRDVRRYMRDRPGQLELVPPADPGERKTA